MTIQAGDRIPDCTLKTMGADGPRDISTSELFDGRKVVLFAVPGAFTPGCSNTHLPGFVVNARQILAKGVDEIACMAVNDAFVMDAWGRAHNADSITMLADGNAEFTKALGLDVDYSKGGMGVRCKRTAMIVNDGKVEHIAVDSKGIEETAAQKIMEKL